MPRTDLTVTIDPKVRYLSELCASHERLSLSRLIEHALVHTAKNTLITQFGEQTSVWDAALWAEHAADRLVKLADRLEALLNDQQRELWAYIQQRQEYWNSPLSEGSWGVTDATFNFLALRADWNELTKRFGRGGL